MLPFSFASFTEKALFGVEMVCVLVVNLLFFKMLRELDALMPPGNRSWRRWYGVSWWVVWAEYVRLYPESRTPMTILILTGLMFAVVLGVGFLPIRAH